MAQRALVGPECPESLAYLVRWCFALHGRSGIGQFGLAPLTYTAIRHWRKEMGVGPLDSWEVEMLIRLDTVLLAPEEPVKSEPTATQPPVSQRAWPTRKPTDG